MCLCRNLGLLKERGQYSTLAPKSLVLFSDQFKSSNWPPLFVINLKNWYLSKTISFLKCPFIPTFLLLIKARRCDQKNGNIFSQGPICLGVFCLSTF